MIEVTRIRVYILNGVSLQRVIRLKSVRSFETRQLAEEFRRRLLVGFERHYKDNEVQVMFDTRVSGPRWINLK